MRVATRVGQSPVWAGLSPLLQYRNYPAALVESIRTLWVVSGETGLWVYVSGCKSDAEPTPGMIIAYANGSCAMFHQVSFLGGDDAVQFAKLLGFV